MRQAKIVLKKCLLYFFLAKTEIMVWFVLQVAISCMQIPNFKFFNFMIISYVIPFPALQTAWGTIDLFEIEKQTQLKDYQLIYGLRLKSYYLGTILSSSVIAIILAILSQLIVQICFQYVNDLMLSTDSPYFLLEYLFYSVSVISLMLCLSSLPFKNQDIFTVFIAIPCIMNYYIMEFKEEFWAILLQTISPANLIFTRYFHYVAPEPNDFSVLQTLIIFSIQFFLGFLLYIYFDQIIPNKNQTHKNIFFFLKYLNCKKKNFVSVSELELNDNIGTNKNLLEDNQINQQFDRIAIVKIDSLAKIYDLEQQVINNFNLTLYNNEMMCLLGQNGSGKSTVIKLISGFLKKNSGIIKVNKFNIDENLEKIQNLIGFCFQEDYILQDFTAYDNLKYFAQLTLEDQTQLEIKIDNLLQLCQLKEEKGKLGKNLSLGSKRKLSLALALLKDPPILILDEPTVGLDPISKGHIWNLLRKLKQRKCILMTTQYLDEAEELADVIGVLKDGKLQVQGQLDEIKEQLQIGNNILIKCQSDDHYIQVLDQIKNYFKKGLQLKARLFELINFQIKITIAEWKHQELIDFFSFLEFQNLQFSYEVSTLEDIYFQLLINSNQNNQIEVKPLQSQFELFDGSYPEYKVLSQLHGLLLRRLILIKQQNFTFQFIFWNCVCMLIYYKAILFLNDLSDIAFIQAFILFLSIKMYTLPILMEISIQDNEKKIKRLLIIHGVRPEIYWFSHLLINFMYLIFETIIFTIIILLNYKIDVTSTMFIKMLVLNGLTSINLSNQLALLTLIKCFKLQLLKFIVTLIVFCQIYFVQIPYIPNLILETSFPVVSYIHGMVYIDKEQEIYGIYIIQTLSIIIYFWILIFLENKNYKLSIFEFNDGIEVNEISQKCNDKQILEQISLRIEPSQIFGLIGPNGVGKTTLLEIMTKQQEPICGSVQIGDENTQIGYVPQDPILMEDLTVQEHLTIFGLIKGLNRTKIKQFIDRYCQEVMLDKNIIASKLSGGQQKKLALGICLIGGSKRLIMDEPTVGADQIFKKKFKEILLHHHEFQNSSILITTNLMSEAQEICHTLGILIEGKMQFQGSFQNLRNHFKNKTFISLNIYRYIKQDLLKILNENFNNLIQEIEDERFDYFSFLLPDDSFKYSQILEILLKIKDNSSIKNFEIRKLTLDQLFKLYVTEQTEQRLSEQSI